MTLALLLIVVATTVWVGVDASRREWTEKGWPKSAAGWVVACLLVWIVVFPVYLAKRGGAAVRA